VVTNVNMEDMPASGDAGDGGADAVPASPAAGEASSGEAGTAARRRRRPRRRSSAAGAERAAHSSGDGAQDAASAGPDVAPSGELASEPVAAPAYAQPEDLGELFSKVLSGDYDRELEPVVESTEQAAPSQLAAKRVLLPDPEAPKLHKVLAQSGLGSRRDLEQAIEQGRVSVNGQVAHTGQRIEQGDRITLDGKLVKVRIAPMPPRVIAYHKPVGEVVTHDDPQQRPTVFRQLPRLPRGKWQSVGRLDINTEGLLLFTNSGDLANRLMHPRFGLEREYAVRILGTLTEEDRSRLLAGVEIDGQAAAFKQIEDGGGEGVNRWYRVVISEGRNREVRKLFEAAGHAVSRLIRIRYGSVVLPKGLKRGVWVDLSPQDIQQLGAVTGLPRPAPQERRGPGGRRGRGGSSEPRQAQGERGRPPRERGPAKPRPEGRARVADMADESGEEWVGAIPNPLQQTFDKRALQQSRRQVRGDDAPIPNPLVQTFDRRAAQAERKTQRVYDEDGPIPNPLQQSFDKRFVKDEARGAGGGAKRRRPSSGGGIPDPLGRPGPKGGPGRSAAGKPGRGRPGGSGAGGGQGGGQPDPMKTSVGYIGADAFHQKGAKGGGGRRGGGGGGRKR
jgi:23S rRNA pseudouridine2605 synthase